MLFLTLHLVLASKISIACDFNDEYICGYRQMTDMENVVWERSEFNKKHGKTDDLVVYN